MSYAIELPSQGCNVYYGNYLDNYHNGHRSRYYLNDGKLVLSNTSSYSSLPSGVNCLSAGDLIYRPEIDVYFQSIALVFVFFLFFSAYRLIIHPFWRKS